MTIPDLSRTASLLRTNPSEAQTAFLARVDELIMELEEGLVPFKEGHPALTAQQYTLTTHPGDFQLPPRPGVDVEAHALSEWVVEGKPVEIVLYREVKDSTVSYGLYTGLAVSRPTLARCVILKPFRVKELFIGPDASVDLEDDTSATTGLRYLETLVGLVKGLAA